TTYSDTLYMECRMPAGERVVIPRDSAELAAYVVSGAVSIGGEPYPAGVMVVAAQGQALAIDANEASRVMIVGGASLGERHVWWNFVSSSRERIEQAKNDWRDGRFEPVPGDDEFIPLPDR
ncbi:MAG: hypothetical protein HKN64_01480, partial [Woeseiaceae bacterium]|nr:hypothetical protein [Woeseiaceae bacterium]